MIRPDEFGRIHAVFLAILIRFALQDVECQLLVVPAGPSLVQAVSGSSPSLAVSFSGARDPAVTWFMGDLPVVTWTVASATAPDIAPDRAEVLGVGPGGSLTFRNVPVEYSSNYTVTMTKSGLGTSSTTFTLQVFDLIQGVTLRSLPSFASEGSERFTLTYSMLQGVVERRFWFFNGTEIRSGSHYLLEDWSLVILNPNRRDTGVYALTLTNPFNSDTAHINVTVRYGPDDPMIESRPDQSFYVSGDSLEVSCSAEGFPPPAVDWIFAGQTISNHKVLNLTNVNTTQSGVYTCRLQNEDTNETRLKSIDINVYERPSGDPSCSVWSVDNQLQYRCVWMGGTPEAELSFPELSNSSRGRGNFSLTSTASSDLDGKTVTCRAEQPLERNNCSVTAKSPMKFLPTVMTDVDSEGLILVTIGCVSEASPRSEVSWFADGEEVSTGAPYQISSDSAHLHIRHHNVSNFLLKNYSCTCRNPLGSRRRDLQLQAPAVSDSGLFPNPNGTVVTVTWEVPPTSVVTGFDVQMKGPDLLKDRLDPRTRSSLKEFRTIQQKPGGSRSADVYTLDPKSTYWFRIVPKAGLTNGEPSKENRIGPGGGLSGPAIAGIAAGIPCSLLFLFLLVGFICFWVYWNKNKSHPTYPVTRGGGGKVRITSPVPAAQTEMSPHNLKAAGIKSPPDYNRLHQTPSERSVALPTFVPPPPVRVATTV